MIKVTRYEPVHLDKIRLRECYSDIKPKAIEGLAMSFLDEGGEVLAILGGYPIHDRSMGVWGLVSDEVRKQPIAFHKAVGLLIRFWFDQHKIVRMQMSVSVGFKEGWRWAHSLGFVCEGTMKKYGLAGEDCWLFARVKNDGC